MKATLIPICIVIFVRIVTVCSLACGQTQPVLIGVLEDHPGHFAGEPDYRAVRMAFYQVGERWEAFPGDCSDQDCLKTIATKYPRQVNWTIAFDGRELGTVAGSTPDAFDSYSSVGQQVVTSKNIPTVGQPSREFGGFLDKPVYRPLIAVSQPNYRDPEGWRRAELSATLAPAIRQQFRQRFPRVMNCTKGHVANARPWSYQDNNITVHKTYASKRGWIIAEVVLSPYRCDGPVDEPFTSQWFAVTPRHEVRLLGSGMSLVDVGDYNGDGKSELVFSIDDYNHGGYRLFYDHFRRSAVFQFNYH